MNESADMKSGDPTVRTITKLIAELLTPLIIKQSRSSIKSQAKRRATDKATEVIERRAERRAIEAIERRAEHRAVERRADGRRAEH